MKSLMRTLAVTLAAFGILFLLHLPLLRLPYFWDEAGYYIPAAFDFYRRGALIPMSTQAIGHTPLVPIFLGMAWRVFGFSTLVARSAMILIAAATLVATYALARRFARFELAAWVTLLLAVSPLFFAQSSLAHLDTAVTLFTTLAILALVNELWPWYGAAASLAILSKETAVILLPVAWLWAWRRKRIVPYRTWLGLVFPLIPLIIWTIYYHHTTGFWTGNNQYLKYNLYSAFQPARIVASFVRRVYKVFVGGFNWVLVAGAATAAWRSRKHRQSLVRPEGQGEASDQTPRIGRHVSFVAAWLTGVYVVFHSFIGGAVLPRYLLPIYPVFYLALVIKIDSLPRAAARAILTAAAVSFVIAWFIKPPYPFPYEDNLAYATFVRLHVKAAHFLAEQPDRPRILTAWPATDELSRPFLGYVDEPLRVVGINGFTPQDFREISPQSFDILYIYSRKWDPSDNWLRRLPAYQALVEHLVDYAPAVPEQALARAYRLKLLTVYQESGQWVKVYSR